jgi:hypothetical protein
MIEVYIRQNESPQEKNKEYQDREQHRVGMERVMPLGVFVFHDCSIYRSDVRVNKKEAPVDAVRLWLVQPSGRNGFVERVKFTHWPVPKLDAVRHQSVQCLGVAGGFHSSPEHIRHALRILDE